MGVINLTPDSFSDGGRYRSGGAIDVRQVADSAAEMVEAGASIVDLGGESTRPGAAPVDEDEECRRVLPVLEALLHLDVVLSVDTAKAGVARRAIDLGAHLINDISGLADPLMLDVLRAGSAGVVLMHMQGKPRTMQKAPRYDNVVDEVRQFLSQRRARCLSAGIAAERICLDPGFGFGKTLAHNLLLLQHLSMFKNGGALMVGLSRKSMIGTITGQPVTGRLGGSIAAALLAVERGADIVRVHDVAATVDALEIWQAVQSVQEDAL